MTDGGKKTKALLIIAIALACGELIGVFVFPHLILASTDSTGHYLFWKLKKDIVAQDEYISFMLTHPLLNNGHPELVTKRAGCIAGQAITVKDRRFFCDGTSLGVAKTHSLAGVPIQHFNFNGVIPENKVFAIGIHVDSLDSRYYGFIDRSQILSISVPLI